MSTLTVHVEAKPSETESNLTTLQHWGKWMPQKRNAELQTQECTDADAGDLISGRVWVVDLISLHLGMGLEAIKQSALSLGQRKSRALR